MKKSILGSGSILRSKSIISFIMSNVVSYFHIWVLILLLNENGTKKLVQYPKSVVRRCTIKKVFLEISQNSQENTCARVCVLIKLQAWVCNLFKKETLALVFSCEFCEISKNNFFTEHLRWLLLKPPSSLMIRTDKLSGCAQH